MHSSKKKAIAVLSGGLDSTVATTYFHKQYQIHALTFDYGQRSSNREIESSREICKELNIKHTVMDLSWLGKLGKSALTSQDREVPSLKNEELDDKQICDDTARKVWVPGRNIVFTAIATAFAESEDAEIIIVGWDEEEATTFPDNSREFLDAFNQTLGIGTLEGVQIAAPLIDLSKKEIVELGHQIAAPMEFSYSCYMGTEHHCGTCESCMRRKRAFLNSNIEDKTIYE
ncbi:7-cyano-7-deazaguanine synthase QueC [Methanobacterium alkalithermotolerans]|uniref:7-cyano-7-deazaguanine synthase n=1 Tax=Methanobacterium alkalithermotolerans TaxID=2731220 RepID=A0A8T8K7N9_9EURY|nr:7-cyano-7-deazaguanine synthase QueC [Methanobacterium alkalithermotolerans]RJS48378.1 MAG: 7-cyano-7-deazaguanine synthase QueC [Methanobacterium sp.]